MSSDNFLKLILDTEEWQNFECKRAAVRPTKLLETVVAFANSDGGFLVVGLEDPEKVKGNKRLVGVSENPDNVSEFLKLIDKEITPPIQPYSHIWLEIENIRGNDDHLLVVNIKKSTDIHSLKHGDTFIRRGRQNVKLTAEEIVRLKYQKGSIKFEDEIPGQVSFDDLDAELLQKYMANNQSKGRDKWQFLKDNGLAVKQGRGFKLTNSGVLLFAKNPSISLGRKCGIKISRYYGIKPSYSGKPNFVHRPITIEGPLISQIEQALQYFQDLVKNSPPKLIGALFQPSMLIPEWVFQEAIVNAVIHRDYSVQEDIQVRIFDNRIEVESPGTYPGHITISNIRSERFARNPIILRTLNRFKDAPNLDIGEGVDRMFYMMQESNLYEPLYIPPKLRPNSVLVILYNLQKVEYWDTVNNYLDKNFKITNAEVRSITGIKDTLRASRLLKSWTEKGLLERIGGRSKRVTYYRKPGVEPPISLFSTGVENKTE
ncbi:MAG: putative DNA binding domain-containing protein [Actinomycetota bacterium]|nr:putative DNA binding domain-containing protein [Actinomycetota bacterium]